MKERQKSYFCEHECLHQIPFQSEFVSLKNHRCEAHDGFTGKNKGIAKVSTVHAVETVNFDLPGISQDFWGP